MNKTSIDWPGLGYSWNPIVGCANGCSYCYARKISNRFKMIPDFAVPQFFPQRIDEPGKVMKPATIFVGSMCDIFSLGVSATWIHHILETVKNCPQHTFMFLTKKPWYYRQYTWPENCWLGATVTHEMHDEGISFLEDQSNKTFVSIEPILSDFFPYIFDDIDLVIIGADSTPGAPKPPVEWIESIVHPNIHYKKSITSLYPQFKNKP